MKKKSLSIYHITQWPVWILISILWLLTRLPYKIMLKTGRFLGLIAFYFARREKKIARINIDKCFPEYTHQQKKNLLKQSFMDMGMGTLETAFSWWGSRARLKKLLRVEGISHLKAALQKKKGVIIFAPHFSALHICGYLANLVHPVGVMFLPPKNPVFKLINQIYINQSYAFTIPRNDIRGFVKALKNNQALFYTPDTDAGKHHGEFVPFFGVMAATLTALPRLAKLTQCAVMPMNYFRCQNGSGYEMHFLPALENYPTDNVDQDMRKINQFLEKFILDHPEQYLWQYKRFKTRPLGEKRFY